MRRLIVVGVTAAAVAVSGAPAHAATKADRKQNAAIKKVRKSASKINKKANAAQRAADSAGTLASSAEAAANTADKKGADAGAATTALSARVDGILAAATSALTQLSDGLKQVAAGLTTAGAGLTRLGDFVGADEYGIVAIGFGAAPGTPIPGCFYETGNIPDNVQSAIVSGTCLVPSSVPAGSAVRILAGIRSNEVDGVADGNAAGVAGIVAYSQTGNSAANQGAGVANLPVVTPLGGGATAPAAAGQPPAVPIPLKSPPTSTTETSFAFAPITTDVLVDLGSTQFAGTPASPVFGDPATTPNRQVQFTVRFTDLTSAADNPKE